MGEHLVDRAAAALGIDAIEMRRRNVFPDDGYPASTASGVKLKDLSHQRCIDTLVERMRYPELRAEQARLRKQGIHRGIGIACFIKGTAPGPHGYYGMGGAPISLQDACVIRLEPNGGVLCSVGVTEQGQGTDTVMGQIAAAALGVPFESVRVISGDTDAIPYGGGTFGSRAVAIGGEAVYQADRDLRQEILQIAGVLLQANTSTLDIVDGVVVDRAGGAKRLPLAEIGRIGHFQLAELPRGMQPVLSHTRRFHLADDLYIFTNGIHGAYVEVDTDTGFVRLLKHWVVEDCGRVINPQLADEQVRGGCVQGLGGALYEHCIYDEAGQLQNGTMADGGRDAGHRRGACADADLGVGAGRQGRGRVRNRRRPRRRHERHQRCAAPVRCARDRAADHAGGGSDCAGEDLRHRCSCCGFPFADPRDIAW